MAAPRKKRKKEEAQAGEGWLTTFADMLTLLLCFFAILFNPIITDDDVLRAISDYFTQFDWGYSLSPGQMVPAGNVLAELPSQTRGRALADTLRRAVALFNPEIRSNSAR